MDLQCPQNVHNLFCLPSRCAFIIKKHAYVLVYFLVVIITTAFLCALLSQLYPTSLLSVPSYFSSPLKQKPTAVGRGSKGDCDYSNGRWVWDENYPRKKYTENCPFLDPGFRCRRNGRAHEGFRKWRWQPFGCELPRFNSSDFLERSRNGRIVFAGDSVGRNQWESLLCMLAQGVSNRSSINEENGSPISKHKGFLSIKFEDYNLTVEYYRVPFLVFNGRPPKDSPEQVRGTIRVDQIHWYAGRWVGADVLLFNNGHWWNKDKTINSGLYFQQEGTLNITMDYLEAYRRSMKTWKTWAIQKLDSQRTHVFFRSYSPVHYRKGAWNGGGTCRNKTAPETDERNMGVEQEYNQIISDVIKEMEAINRKAKYLNITYLTEFRTDGHPSLNREPGTPLPIIEDCSHWCLPGVPDTWNEIFYAHLLSMGFKANHIEQRRTPGRRCSLSWAKR